MKFIARLRDTKGTQACDYILGDFIVNNVRKTLYHCISSFSGNLDEENSLLHLIKVEYANLAEAFHLSSEAVDDLPRVASKLLNLYRTGRLGHYSLDSVPSKHW
ncbi:unnamed protein product [Cuscuta europaea]|uniref:Uncharacterized protein n=1 Tax=Cuscuta europaea TaxID=41803 RepID=A0A9P0ZN19_CUSEU|nr:unnamed protein product [Cuscuta europaea]